MSDNTILNAGTGGDTIRTIDRTATTGGKTQVIALDTGGEAGPEALVRSLAAETGGNLDTATQLLAAILAQLKVNSYFLSVIAGTGENPDTVLADYVNNLPL